MKKRILILMIILSSSLFSTAFTQDYQWAKRIGGSYDQYINNMAIDYQGNIYVIGALQGTNVDFDPGAGTTSLSSAGGVDIFIAKYSAAGNFLWAKRIGGSGDDVGARIKTDAAGNVYIAGWFQSSNVDFDPGAGTAILSSAGNTDIFFAKYDTNGNYRWANRIGNTSADGCHDIYIDGLNHVYITGYFYGTNTDFDPGSGTALLNSISNSGDIFFAKYDSSGNYLWAKSVGGSAYEVGNGITLDNFGNVYITGPFSGTNVDFDPGPGTAYLNSAAGFDIFFARYDASGNYLWAKSVGGAGDNIAADIVVDASANIYITSFFQGTNIDFDPGAGTVYLNSAGGFDLGLAKYDASGNCQWAERIGGTGDDYPGDIFIDNIGSIYFTGSFAGTKIDFDPGSSAAYLNSAGNRDICIAKYSTSGNYVWAARIGGTSDDFGNAIAVNSLHDIYVAGGFSGTNVDFNPGSGNAPLSSAGGADIFIAKYSYTLSGPYLGQTPPDTIPKRFPPASLLSDGVWWYHGSPSFSPDGAEMYFVKYVSNKPGNNMEMYYTKMENGEWTSPRRPSFASDSSDNSPVFSADGNKMLFTSYRDGTLRIYQVTRIADGWSQPQALTLPGGSAGLCISITRDETIYFDLYDSDSGIDIYRSRLVNGQYSQYEKLPPSINSASNDVAAYIDPDESYMLFMSNRPGGFGMNDLYISCRNQDGTWTTAQNLGSKINGANEDGFPAISPDGKYFFFTSAKTGDAGYNVYWVDSKIIDKFRPVTDVESEKDQFPIEFKLFQNYPNPFNPETKIQFSLPKREFVTMKIFDVLGREITTLLQKTYEAGVHSVRWNGAKYPSGIYFCQLSTDSCTETRKMILAR